MNIFSLFLEGLLSFFSPCVLPVVPLYIGYLTQDAKTVDDDGKVTYHRSRTLFLTLGFILGICMVFVIAAMSSTALHAFFVENKLIFQVMSGILLLLFGLVSFHVINIPFLNGTHIHTMKVQGGMTFLKAMVMGFFFSFAWSPCVGPLLAQALIKAASAESTLMGWVYIGAYALGFICIFLLLGLFTSEVLNFLNKYKKAVKYTGVIAGLVVLGMGVWTLGQAGQTYRASMNSVDSGIAAVIDSTVKPSTEQSTKTSTEPSAEASTKTNAGAKAEAKTEISNAEIETETSTETNTETSTVTKNDTKTNAGNQTNTTTKTNTNTATTTNPTKAPTVAATPVSTPKPTPIPTPVPTPVPTPEPTASIDMIDYNFSLPDINGNYYTLSNYLGRPVVVNFFGTYCYYCNLELPGLQNVQNTYSDVQVLLIAAPNVYNPSSLAEIESSMNDKGYTMKILYDTNLSVTRMYGVNGYPNSFIYNSNGAMTGYIPGYAEESYLFEEVNYARQ